MSNVRVNLEVACSATLPGVAGEDSFEDALAVLGESVQDALRAANVARVVEGSWYFITASTKVDE